VIPRVLPALTELNRSFWTTDMDAPVLRIHRCADCRLYLHPPVPRCRGCQSAAVTSEPVSGRAVVYSFTVNHHRWTPEVDGPYVVAIVELAEQQGLRLTTNIVGCDVDDVHIGMPVSVRFEDCGDVQVPVFAPASSH
jgi:hypothetical protein